ncbi:MAG: hypothetical protein LBS88_01670, partial [Tannerellaceae bacterium]|nr:hypothetical protein [Tannerellaceae bacterium]
GIPSSEPGIPSSGPGIPAPVTNASPEADRFYPAMANNLDSQRLADGRLLRNSSGTIHTTNSQNTKQG